MGPLLMALPLPDGDAAWQYALEADTVPEAAWVDGLPQVRVAACLAPDWGMKGGVIQPPPQGFAMGEAYELTLLPYAETAGRIAAFPQAGKRA